MSKNKIVKLASVAEWVAKGSLCVFFAAWIIKTLIEYKW